jgi:hypothetical protein
LRITKAISRISISFAESTKEIGKTKTCQLVFGFTCKRITIDKSAHLNFNTVLKGGEKKCNIINKVPIN